VTPRRTEYAAFVLDLMDFIEEKIVEAMENEPSRVAAIGEAAGAIPVLRGRLRENDAANAQAILALGNMIEQRWASGWWEDFSKMKREEFERTAGDLIGPQGRLAILTCHRGGGRVVVSQTEACRFVAQQSGTTFSGSN
jgi:hypothetical protein